MIDINILLYSILLNKIRIILKYDDIFKLKKIKYLILSTYLYIFGYFKILKKYYIN